MSAKVHTPSIKDALSAKNSPNEISAIEQHQVYNNTNLTRSFTMEQFREKWNEFLDTVDSPTIKTTLSLIPEFTEDYRFILKIENSVQEENLKQIKPRLVSFLRSALGNSSIEINMLLEEKKMERIIYSDDEKYEEMVKKNPELHALRQTFNLDFGD